MIPDCPRSLSPIPESAWHWSLTVRGSTTRWSSRSSAPIKAYHESLGNVSCCERDPEFRATARDNVVARVLLAQEAGRSVEPTPEPELDAAVEKLKEEYGGEGWFFARTGATPETMHLVRRDVDLDLRVRRLMQELGDDGGPPAEPELRRFYEEHLDAFKTAEEVRASHILKTGRGGGGAAAEGREQAYDDASPGPPGTAGRRRLRRPGEAALGESRRAHRSGLL